MEILLSGSGFITPIYDFDKSETAGTYLLYRLGRTAHAANECCLRRTTFILRMNCLTAQSNVLIFPLKILFNISTSRNVR